MINTSQRQKQGFFRGCVVPIIVVFAMMAACYGFCLVLFLLQPPSVRGF
jgi:hypothetical protein